MIHFICCFVAVVAVAAVAVLRIVVAFLSSPLKFVGDDANFLSRLLKLN